MDVKFTKGWRLFSADFSLNANHAFRNGSVTLVRDPDQRKAWNRLPPHVSFETPLYVSGFGTTLESAIKMANNPAAATPEIPVDNPSTEVAHHPV